MTGTITPKTVRALVEDSARSGVSRAARVNNLGVPVICTFLASDNVSQ
jgi:hypothetical protein